MQINLFTHIIDSVSEEVFTLSQDQTILWCNSAFINYFNTSKETALKSSIQTFFPSVKKVDLQKVLEEASQKSKPLKFSIKSKIEELTWSIHWEAESKVFYFIRELENTNLQEKQELYLEQLERYIIELSLEEKIDINELLKNYVAGLERIFPSIKASILKVENDRVWHIASHSLPETFVTAINGLPIGPKAGSCGTAAFKKKRIVVTNISEDPLWEDYKAIALPLDLRACWSQPIFNAQKQVIATFANYYAKEHKPSKAELKVFGRSASLIGIILEHHLKSKKLQSANELYKLVHRATNDAIYDWNTEIDKIEWGESFERLFGHSEDKMPKTLAKFESLIHPKDIHKTLGSLSDFLRDGEKSRWVEEYRLRKSDNTYAFVEEKGFVIRDTEGKPVRMIGVLRDISEEIEKNKRKKLTSSFIQIFNSTESLENALNDVNKLLLKAADVNTSEIWLIESNKEELKRISAASFKEGKIVFSNKKVKNIKKGEGIVGTVWESKKHHISTTKAEVFNCNEITGNEFKNCLIIPLIQNKELFGIWLCGSNLDPVDFTSTIQLWKGISPMLTAEISRKWVEEELSHIFKLAPDIICLLDKNGNLKRVNPAAEKILGFPENLLLKKSFSELLHPIDENHFVSAKKEIKRNKEPFHFQNRFVTQSGEVVWLDWTCTVALGEDDYYCVAKNITQERILQELLGQANQLSKIGSWEIDLVSDSIFWSPITYEIHEIEDNFNLNFESALSFFKKSDRKKIIDVIKKAKEEGTSWDFEMPITTEKGKKRWIRSIGQVEKHKDKVVRIFGSIQNIHQRKTVELQLEETLAENQQILERIGDGFFAVTKNWKVIYWNKTAEESLNTPKSSTIGKNIWDVFPDAVEHASYENYHKAMETGQVVHFKDFYAPVNRWFEISAYPSKTGLSVYFKDVTAEVSAQKQLKISNERFEKVTLATKDAIWDWDVLKGTHYRGKGFRTLFGDKKIGLTKSNNWKKNVHPDDIDITLKTLDVAVSDVNSTKWEHEYRYKKEDGKYAYVSDRGLIIRNKKGTAVRLVGAMTDISNQVEYQKSLEKLNKTLQESQQRYMDLFHLSPIPMWVYNLETYDFLDVNNAALQHYGYTKDEFLSLTLADIRPSEDIPKMEKAVMNVREGTRKSFGNVFRHCKKNGDIIFVEIKGNKIDFNDVKAEIVLATDITEKLKYVKEIEKQNKRLKDIAWEQSHEVRAPLSRLLAIVDLLHHGKLETVEKDDFLNDIATTVEEIDSVVKKVANKADILNLELKPLDENI